MQNVQCKGVGVGRGGEGGGGVCVLPSGDYLNLKTDEQIANKHTARKETRCSSTHASTMTVRASPLSCAALTSCPDETAQQHSSCVFGAS